MKDFKKPDLNAPRYRPSVLEIVNKEFYTEFKKQYPEYKDIPNKELKDKIKAINQLIYQTIISERDGIELPNGLGCIFIGSCPVKTTDNIDYKLSIQYGKKIQHRNWDTDGMTAKVYYTNYEQKYSFKYHELWGFKPHKDFRQEVAKSYPLNWTRYTIVDSMVKVSRLFRKLTYKQQKQKENQVNIIDYNDLAID